MVDIGGGVGSVTVELLKRFPHFKYIVQDLPNVVAQGIKVGGVSRHVVTD